MAVVRACGSPPGVLKQNVSANRGVLGRTSFLALMKMSSVLQNNALQPESFKMYVQSLGSWVSYCVNV
jgi:hypothetical protein